MADRFDVIVVGARCAGSPLATLLSRQGLKVALIERATFPKDTLSTHIFQGPAIKFLDRLGVLDQVLATGTTAVNGVDLRLEDFRVQVPVSLRPADRGTFMSVRRFVLDPILLGAAREAGAKTLMATKVTGLVEDGGRVDGVRVVHRGRERELRAPLVVGADGRNSTVADLVGARKYNVTPGERFGYWAFFAGADPGPDPPSIYHRWEGRLVLGMPADDGLYQVIVLEDPRFLPEFKRDREAAFLAHARACRPVAEIIAGARQVGKLLGMLKYECFFREAAGPGWALVGDAGHFKDPAPGQGIADAFRQAEALAAVVADTIEHPAGSRDQAIAEWARWRDRDAADHYWLASDFGAPGELPTVAVEMARHLAAQGKSDQLIDVFQHRRMPSRVFTPGRMVAATARLMVRPGVDRGRTLREARDLVVANAQRSRLGRRPAFVALDSHRDAGETETDRALAA
jgi:2-polyprenyl-6-methoxyphenol hydroxylase-like FAD-dependent oxidoreductase